MAKVAVKCPGCGTRYSVLDEHLGKRVRCKKCGNAFITEPATDTDSQPIDLCRDKETCHRLSSACLKKERSKLAEHLLAVMVRSTSACRASMSSGM